MNVKLFVQRAAITALATLTFSSDLAAQVSPPPPATAAENTTNAAIPILPERVKPYPKIVLPERAMTNALNEADRIKREMPVTDNLGRIYYTVMLNDNATDGALPEFPSGTENRFGSWHKPSMLRLNAVLEKAYGFTATSVTSWLLNSFSAYLTQTQVVALRKDARVQLIEENHPVQPSALWVDGRVSGSDSPQVPWGVLALGGPRYSNATTRVWVLDAGVGLHSYLPGVFFRTNIISSSLPVVGCYSHATMVAGVVGAYATGSNSNGILGFNSQVPTGSISYLNALGSSNCATGSFNSPSDIVNALDYIRSVPATKVPVVNMSFGSQNPNSGIGVDATFRLAVQRVTQPATNFPGAFVVEAAGNRADDACAYIYVPPSGHAEVADGIMVVGGIDANGQPVKRLNTLGSYRNTVDWLFWEPGSNYGNCVDIWAPSNNVLSTGGGTTFLAKDQAGGTSYSAKFTASGTSFAAPLVAGLAAYLIETESLPTPQAVESRIRSFYTAALPGSSLGAQAVTIPNLNHVYPTASPTVEWRVVGPEGVAKVNALDNTVSSGALFTLSYDSVGASSCNLTAYIDGVFWYPANGIVTAWDWNGQVYIDNNTGASQVYQWNIDCVSSNNTHGYASTAVTVRPAPRIASGNFYVNGEKMYDGLTQYTNSRTTQSFTYYAENVTTCDVRTDRNDSYGFRDNWYDTGWVMPSSYDWGPTRWDANIVNAQLVTQTYWYKLTCHVTNGNDFTTGFTLIVDP